MLNAAKTTSSTSCPWTRRPAPARWAPSSDLLAKQVRNVLRIDRGPNEEAGDPERALRVWKVEQRRRRAVNDVCAVSPTTPTISTRMPFGAPSRIARPTGFAFAEVPAREGPVDDADAHRRARVGIRKRPATNKRRLHHLEVTGARYDDFSGLRSIRLGGIPFDREGQRHRRREERHPHAECRILHAGQPPKPVEQLDIEREPSILRGVFGLRKIDGAGQHARHVEARIHPLQMHEASDEKAGAREQHQRERNFKHNQDVLRCVCRRSCVAPRPPPLSVPLRSIPLDAMHRHESEEHSRRARQHERKSEHPVDRCGRRARARAHRQSDR